MIKDDMLIGEVFVSIFSQSRVLEAYADYINNFDEVECPISLSVFLPVYFSLSLCLSLPSSLSLSVSPSLSLSL